MRAKTRRNRPQKGSFWWLLGRATARISTEYFHLPIDGSDLPVYRERVYFYELYHQLRRIWPRQSPYTLGGEIDKSGHPLFRDGQLKRAKPDMLVHIPGKMAGNFTVVEVKPISARRRSIEKDLVTLTLFMRQAGYRYSTLLVYGGDYQGLRRFIRKANQASEGNRAHLIDLANIALWWHQSPGLPAKKTGGLSEVSERPPRQLDVRLRIQTGLNLDVNIHHEIRS